MNVAINFRYFLLSFQSEVFIRLCRILATDGAQETRISFIIMAQQTMDRKGKIRRHVSCIDSALDGCLACSNTQCNHPSTIINTYIAVVINTNKWKMNDKILRIFTEHAEMASRSPHNRPHRHIHSPHPTPTHPQPSTLFLVPKLLNWYRKTRFVKYQSSIYELTTRTPLWKPL